MQRIFFLALYLFLHSIRYFLFSLGLPHSIFPKKLCICLHPHSKQNSDTLQGMKRQLQNSSGFGLYRKSIFFYTQCWSAGRRLLKVQGEWEPWNCLGDAVMQRKTSPFQLKFHSFTVVVSIFQLIWQRVRGVTGRGGREWCQETGSASLGTGQHFAC